MATDQSIDVLSEQSRKGLVGRKIVRVDQNSLHFDDGQAIFLDEEEIETINYRYEKQY